MSECLLKIRTWTWLGIDGAQYRPSEPEEQTINIPVTETNEAVGIAEERFEEAFRNKMARANRSHTAGEGRGELIKAGMTTHKFLRSEIIQKDSARVS